MRRHTRSFLTCTLLAGLLLPVLAQANARLDSQRLNYDRALEAIDKLLHTLAGAAAFTTSRIRQTGWRDHSTRPRAASTSPAPQ